MNNRVRRLAAAALCCAVIISALLSALFIVKAASHDCTGAHCAVCACIKAAAQQLEKLGGACVKAARAVSAPLWCTLVCRAFSQISAKASPVLAKVRLNN